MRSDSNIANANIVIEGALRDHAAAFHIFDIPPGSMSIMLDAALSKVKAMGPDALTKLSAGSAVVTDAVRTGFSAVYGGMSETQKKAEFDRREAGAAASLAGAALGEFGGRYMSNMALAMRGDGGSSGKGDRTSSAAYKANLAADATAISYAKQLGIDPAYASFFTGGSLEMKNALRDAVTKGTTIADDKVKSMGDVKMVLGAIRSGSMKSDDPRIPDSVKRVIQDMKEKGVDPATAKPDEINSYLKKNPDALKKIRAKNAESISTKNVSHGAKVAEAESKDKKAKEAPVVAKAKLGFSVN